MMRRAVLPPHTYTHGSVLVCVMSLLTPTEKTVLMPPDRFSSIEELGLQGDDKYYGTYIPAGSCTVRRAITATITANTLRPIAAVSDLANCTCTEEGR